MYTFDVAAPDELGVLTSTAPVARGAAHVRIAPEAVERFARRHAGAPAPFGAEDGLHCAFLPPGRLLNYLLALEALNFCFWDEEPRWRVAWGGARHDGYWALAAALRRAIREDALPLWDAHWLADAGAERTARLLRGEGRPVPLLAARAAHLREAGSALLERWNGQFAEVVAAAQGDAVTLALRLAAEFPSFRDETRWRDPATGREHSVRFLKRAQICAADLARLLPGDPQGRLRGLERLTAFADYKVPQALRREGILVYGAALAERLERREELAAGSAEEVEIRAATVWACAWIARAVAPLRPPGAPGIGAAEVDGWLWLAGQDPTGLQPYHRTRTVYY